MYPPTVIETSNGVERSYDVYSRLLKDRIIFVSKEVTSDMASSIIAQLLFLNKESSTEPILMYINTPGGSVADGLAIYDTMRNIEAPVHTTCTGMAASMGSILLCGGDKRFCLEHSSVMIHQVSGGARGTTADVKTTFEYQQKLNKTLNGILAKNCGQTVAHIDKISQRDYYMDAEQALEFGIIDEIIK